MSPWLKPRLVALFCGAALIGGATFLNAQNDYPAPAKTPEDAAANFYRFLTSDRSPVVGQSEPAVMVARNTASDGGEGNTPIISTAVPAPSPGYGFISRAQATNFSASRDQISRLFDVLSLQLTEPVFDARVTGTANGQTVVEVAPAAKGRGRDVVVVAEDGGYRVDLKATYARWNHLSGESLDESWWRYTGIVSSALASNGHFLNSNCQSNLKQIGLAFAQYTQDYDERYPPAHNWINALQPYVRSEQLFKCPALGKPGSGYAYNSKMSQLSLAAVMNPASTINVYETSNRARNVFAPFTGRAYRHELRTGFGMNICFADGHVKWLARGQKVGITATPDADPTGFLTISTRATQ